jgi:hypothetical protein
MPEVFLTHTEPCESNCIPLPVAGPLRDAGPPTPHPTPPSNPIIAFLGLIIFFGFLFFCVAGWFFFGRENDYRWCGSLRSKGKKNVTGTAVNRSGAEHEMPSITSHESTIYDKDKKQIAGIVHLFKYVFYADGLTDGLAPFRTNTTSEKSSSTNSITRAPLKTIFWQELRDSSLNTSKNAHDDIHSISFTHSIQMCITVPIIYCINAFDTLTLRWAMLSFYCPRSYP